MAGIDEYTKLLLHMDDSSFKDEYGHTITNNGVVSDSSIKKFGSSSSKFNGTNSYLSLLSSNDFTFESGEFTIDVWVYPNSNNPGDVISKGASSSFSPFRIAVISGNWAFLSTTTGSAWDLTGNNGIQFGTVDIGVWQHLAICRSGNTIYMFKNGNLINTLPTSSALWNNSDPLNIGRINYSTPVYFNGYLDEVRISKGIARWTSNFTPPTSAYSSLNKYLIQQGTDIYATKSSFYGKVGQVPVTEDVFLNYGADDLTALTTSQTQNTALGIDKNTLGSGKYFSIPFNSDYQSINNINIS